jgi:hypothetical protein
VDYCKEGVRMKNVIFGILLAYLVCDLHAVDDKIWGFWMSRPGMSGTKRELKLEWEYHMEKNKDLDMSGMLEEDREILERYTIFGTMVYPGNGGIFYITGIEEVNSNEYILFLMTSLGADRGIPVYGEGTVRMVFIDEDTIYFERIPNDRSGTNNQFFQFFHDPSDGPSDIKYRAEVVDAYYPERAGILRYEERKRLDEQEKAMAQEEYTGIEVQEEYEVEQQPGTALPLVIVVAAAGIAVAAGVVVVLLRRKK